jgi:hypothetical protein
MDNIKKLYSYIKDGMTRTLRGVRKEWSAL